MIAILAQGLVSQNLFSLAPWVSSRDGNLVWIVLLFLVSLSDEPDDSDEETESRRKRRRITGKEKKLARRRSWQ